MRSPLVPIPISKRPVASVERKWNGAKYAMTFHGELFFGLVRSDYSELHGKNSVNWTRPSASDTSRNARRVKTMVAGIDEEDKEEGEDKYGRCQG